MLTYAGYAPRALLLIGQGVVQSFAPYVPTTTLEGNPQLLPLGPAASQIAIKKLGTNEGLVMVAAPPDALDKYFTAEEARWRQVIKDAGIKPE